MKNNKQKPILIILDEVDVDIWRKKESFYIEKYKKQGCKLLNYTIGGDGATFQNSGSFKKGQIPLNTKPIIALNKDGTIFREFNSIKQACNLLNLKSINLFNLSSKKRVFLSHGYIWLTKEYYSSLNKNEIFELIDNIKILKENSSSKETQFKKGQLTWNKGLKNKYTLSGKIVYQYSLDKKILINIFNSCKAAAEQLNCSGNNISNCANKKSKSACGYFWSYERINI